MKNQYFGDNRDLFKYDLVYEIIHAKSAVLPKRFTFIPMLTENDCSGHGEDRNRAKAKAGKKNEPLKKFLDKFKEDKSKRDIKHLKSFFKKQGIEMVIYYGKNKFFSSEKREDYFKQLGEELLRKSLIFSDPDTGLEVQRMKEKERYVRYEEVRGLYKHMDKSSILMVFQWISRYENIDKYFRVIPEMLRDKIKSDLPILVSDGKVVFYFLTRENKTLRESLGKVISKYGKCYDLRVKGI